MTQTSLSPLFDTLVVVVVVLLAGKSKNYNPEFIVISIEGVRLKDSLLLQHGLCKLLDIWTLLLIPKGKTTILKVAYAYCQYVGVSETTKQVLS